MEGSTGSTTADSADDEPSTSSSASSEKDSNSKSGITSPSSTTARVAHFWDNYPDQCQSYFNPAKRESSAHFHTLKSHELRHKYGDDGSDIPKIIHFIAYNHNLKSARYLCSVESVLKHNPDHTVYIYTPFPQLFEKDIKSWRRKHDMRDKVKVVRMDFRSVFKGNKLEKWFTTKKYEKSHWVDQNLGNGKLNCCAKK